VPDVRCCVCGKQKHLPPHHYNRLADPKRVTCSVAHRKIARTGKHHWNWNGGRYTDSKGYVRVRIPPTPDAPGGYEYEHVRVARKKLGRPLTARERIRHRDGNNTNNRPNNLVVFTLKPARRKA
jgi:HNH endonuclease